MAARLFHLCIIASTLSLFTSCSQNDKEVFELSDDVKLSNGLIINPLFVDGLLSNPNRNESIWNDSLIKICGINKVKISFSNPEKPKERKEEIEYDFNKHGDVSKYKLFDYSKSTKAVSKSEFYYTKKHLLDSIEVIKFYGIDSKNKLRVRESKNSKEFIYDKGMNKFDQVDYHYKNGEIEMIVKKTGDIILRIDFIVPFGTPMSKLKNMSTKISKDNYLIETADKSVIYIKKQLPIKAYLISLDWAQLDLLKEWTYDESNDNLINYKEFINRTLIKEIAFDYSSDNLLRSIDCNKAHYLFDYN